MNRLPSSICPTGIYMPPDRPFAGIEHRHADAHRPRNGLLIAVTVLGLALLLASLAFAQRGATMIAIENMTTGDFPAEFEFARTGQGAPARWLVVADDTAVHGRAIEQVSNDARDYRFPLAVYQAAIAKNVDVSVRFKAVSGKVDRAAGIAARLVDPDNYYVVRANALENNVRFYRMLRGRREQIAGADIKVTANEWHTLRLRAVNDRFEVYFNDRLLYMTRDRTFSNAGHVALWTKADSVTRFDQIKIEEVP